MDHALHGPVGALAGHPEESAGAEYDRLLRAGDGALAAGRHEDAVAAFEAATTEAPDDHRAWIYLARARLARNETDAALAAIRKGAAAHRRPTGTLVELADLCRENRLWSEAETWCHAALAEDANCGGAWLCLARLAIVRAEPDGALYALGRSGAADFVAHAAYAEAYRAVAQLDLAALHSAEAARLAPTPQERLFNLARMHAARLEWAEAEARLRELLVLLPRSAVAHLILARILLLTGRRAEGLREYEWRPGRAELAQGFRGSRYWDGAPVPGETIFVSGEGGDGDIIHYCRYVPLLKPLAGRILLDVPERLRRLIAASPGFSGIEIGSGFQLPARHKPQHKVTTTSLELFFDGERAALPMPYLAAAPEAVARWREALPKGAAPHPSRRIGIVWAGSDRGRRGDRSIPPGLVAELLDLADAVFVSLQLGDDSLAGRALRARLVDAAPSLKDWGDTAAAISALDLVISVDTSVAHLAGALGRPVWCLLPTPPDSRWGLTGAATPLYPSMRLFRQPRPGDWHAVLAEVKKALLAERAGPPSV